MTNTTPACVEALAPNRRTARDRLRILRLDVQRKQDPHILADLSHEGVNHRAAGWFAVDGEAGLREHLANETAGADDQAACGIAAHGREVVACSSTRRIGWA